MKSDVRALKKIAFCLVWLCFWNPSVHAQEFAREITQFVGENAVPFLQPLADALQSNLQAGMHTQLASDGFHFGVSLVAMGVAIPEESKTFAPKPFSSTVEFTYNGMTFLGDLEIAPSTLPTAAGLGREQTFTGRLQRVRPKGSPYVPGPYDFIQQNASVTIGGYRDISTIFFLTPQATIGSLLGTELTIRYLPEVPLEDVGKLSWFGIGVTHNISQYFSFPFNISASYMYQTMTLKASDQEFAVNADLKAMGGQLRLSKAFSAGFIGIEPFTMAGYEKGRLEVRYSFADPYIGDQTVPLETNGRFRFVAGVAIKVLAFQLHADINKGEMVGYSMGIGLAF